MPFEELPAEYESFFKSGGELPASLLTPAETPVAEAPAPEAKQEPAMIPEPPAVPASNPYLERLLTEKDAQIQALAKQMEELQTSIEKAQEKPAPDPTIDPLGAMTHRLEVMQQKLDAMLTAQKDAQTQTQNLTQQQQLERVVTNQVNAFKADHPDYDEAYKHLIGAKVQEYRDLGLTDVQIRQAIGEDEMKITRSAFAQGKNPAELAYNFAKRYGYQAKTDVKPENKLETIKKGMAASETVQRGTPPEAASITTDNIADLPEGEINKMVSDNWESIFGLRKGVV